MQGAYIAEVPESKENPAPRPYRENRRLNLLLLLKEAGSPSELALKLDTPNTHISAMTRQGQGGRNVGDDLATRAERVFRKPAGWMDEAHDGAPAAAAPVSLSAALAALGEALAADMADDIRQDAADLLAKLAMRRGAPRHQQELTALLEAVMGAVIVPVKYAQRVDVDQPLSHPADEHRPAPPQELGGADRTHSAAVAPRGEGTTWISNTPRTDQQQDHTPGRSPKSSTSTGKSGQ